MNMVDEDQVPKIMTMKEVSSMLHGVLFGLEKTLMTRYNANCKIFIPFIMKELEDLLQDINIMEKDKGIKENLDKIRIFLSDGQILNGVTFEKLDENKYSFNIEQCGMATSGVHEVLKMEKGYCPFALIVATFLSRVLEAGKNMEIGDSEYTDQGSMTVLEIS
jgi:hypothetical protein